MLTKLTRPDPVHEEIETLIAQDVTLSYKVLRYINASCFAMPRKIVSINEAVLYLGLNNIRRFASMMAMSGFSDQPHEVLLTALIRARMCELLAEEADCDDSVFFFTLGLLSTLDIMLAMPMHQVIAELPLEETLEQALLNSTGDMGMALDCVKAYENHQWKQVTFSDLSQNSITRIYLNAVQWSNQTSI